MVEKFGFKAKRQFQQANEVMQESLLYTLKKEGDPYVQ